MADAYPPRKVVPLRDSLEPGSRPRESRGLTAIDGALALIAVLLIVQMWLLTAALEAYLAGHKESVLPALIVSAVLFAAVLGLSRFIAIVDRDVRRGRR
jgi:hypothetical protein